MTEDRTDDKVLAAAVAGWARAVVTNGAHLLRVDGYRGIRVLRASSCERFVGGPAWMTLGWDQASTSREVLQRGPCLSAAVSAGALHRSHDEMAGCGAWRCVVQPSVRPLSSVGWRVPAQASRISDPRTWSLLEVSFEMSGWPRFGSIRTRDVSPEGSSLLRKSTGTQLAPQSVRVRL